MGRIILTDVALNGVKGVALKLTNNKLSKK